MDKIRRFSHLDDNFIEALGHKQELSRNFSFLSLLGLAFAMLNSWTAIATSLSLALPSGGSTSVLWGLITAGVFNLCIAASLAEFLSAYPTAGGQYHWVAMVSPPRWAPLFSYITGYLNVAGWVAVTATAGLLGSSLIVGIISLEDDNYEAKRWQQFVIYIGYILFAFLVNGFANAALPYIGKAAFAWSLVGFAVISITVLATASPNYSSASFVFENFLNSTGWPDGIAWLLGLLQGGFGLVGYDSVAHLIEEIPNAAVIAPPIMLWAVGIGIATSFIFLIILLFVGGGEATAEQVIASTYGPLTQILFNATSSKAGTICLLIFPLVCLVFTAIGLLTTSSRMTWAFARDRGLPFSTFFAKVHGKYGLPFNGMCLTVGLVIIFGCIFLGSSTAFNAIVAASVVALNLSYGVPILIHCLRGRKLLPPRSFTMPAWLGWSCNIIGLVYIILTSVLFLFPPFVPATAASMNYAIAALAVVFVVAVIQWFVSSRKTYTGPKDLSDMLVAQASHPVTASVPHGSGDEEKGDATNVKLD